MLSQRVYSKLKALSNTTNLRMKKRIAKKIYKTVYHLIRWDASCFYFYVVVNSRGNFRCKKRPLGAVYSRSQFVRALNVLRMAYPQYKPRFGRTLTRYYKRY